MKALLMFVSIAMLFLVLPIAAVQQEDRNPPLRTNPPTMRTIEGELRKVDTTAKTITVKTTSAPIQEITVYYDYQTEIVGANGGMQGLTGKTGLILKITYKDEKGVYLATKIEAEP